MKRYVLIGACSLVILAVAVLAGVLGVGSKRPGANQARAATGPRDSLARAAAARDYPPAVMAAIKLAQAVAARSIPGPDGAPVASSDPSANGSSSQWSPNVDRVTANQTTRGIADMYLDGSVPPDGSTPVVVIRMEGTFAMNNTGPAGSVTHDDGRTVTLVVDANDNRVLDSQISPKLKPNGLAAPTTVYSK
jgi:hypothetical protein